MPTAPSSSTSGFDEAEGEKRGRKIAAHAGSRARDDRHAGRQARAIDRLAPALRPCRHHVGLPQGALPSAGGRDALRHRALHVPQPTSAYAVHADHVCEMVRNIYSGPRRCSTRATRRSRRASPCTRSAATAAACNACGWRRRAGRSCSPPTASHYYENFEQGKVFPITLDVENALRRLHAAEEARRLAAPYRARATTRWCCSAIPSLNSQTKGIVHRLDLPRLDG